MNRPAKKKKIAVTMMALAGAAMLGLGSATQPMSEPISTITGTMNTASLAANQFQVDSVHSSVVFKVRHNGVANFYGRFNEVAGTYTIAENGGQIDVTVNADSIDTNHSGRDNHLKSPDYFNVREHPELTFKSEKITKVDDSTFKATGTLSFHGQSKEITVDIKQYTERDGRRGKISGFETVFTVDRSDFGMNGDEVTIIVALEGRGADG